MVAAELSHTRADHRQRMEAKVRAKAARTPLPPVYKRDPTPLCKYGRYQLHGTGNACYLYNITHKSHRLESMFSHHMGPPNVHPHMLCGWKLKLIIKLDDLEKWDILID